MIKIATPPRRGLLALLLVASISQAGLAVVGAYCIQRIFDEMLASGANGQGSSVPWIGALFVLSALTAAGLETLRSRTAEKLGLGYVAEVREALFQRLMNASTTTLSQRRQGGLLMPFVGDLTAVKKWVSDGLVRIISASAMAVFLLGVLLATSPTLGASASFVVLAAAAVVLSLSGPLNAAIKDTRTKRGAVANFVSSSMRAVQSVQAFHRYRREAQRLRRRSDALMSAGLRLALVSGVMNAVVHFAAAALVAVTLLVGFVEVQRGAMSLGVVAAAISIAGLLAGVVRDLGIGFDLWRRAKVSFAKITAALALDPSMIESKTARALPAVGEGVRLERVSVKGLYNRVRVSAAPGDVVNVEGDSGSGKSTLLALIARLRDPDTGIVRVNGKDLQRASIASARRLVGVASVATPLMRGSLAMNLRYRAPSATDAEVERVSRICNLAPIFTKFAEGDQARIADGAPELSLGEGQRLNIARAMLNSPPILILDDVDTHLDAETLASVAGALREYPGVVLMAATTPTLRRIATTVWRIRDERVRVRDGAAKVVGVIPTVAPESMKKAQS